MRREYTGRAAQVVTAVMVAIVLLHLLYISGILHRLGAALGWHWLIVYPVAFRALHLGLITTMGFLLFSATKKHKDGLPWYDLLLIIVGLGSNLYFLIFYYQVESHFIMGIITNTELILGILAIATMVEVGRRAVGIWMPLLALIFFVYPLVGDLLPGFLKIRAHSLANVVRYTGPSGSGMYGSMVNLSATVVVAFLFFAQILQVSKATNFFTSVAMGMFGRLSGGPALASVGASAAFGSICAAGAANAAATGSITIPLMKSIGMTPRFAAAVESVAANGGSILPPVMTTVAFLMADFLGITYWQVVIAAWVPGILYYVSIFIAVYLEARKLGIQGLPRAKLPSIWKAMASHWQFLLPVAVLLYFLAFLRYSPQLSAIYSTLALIAVSMFRKDTRLGWRQLVNALAGTGRTIMFVAPLFALASVMVAGLDFTGLTLRLSGGLVDLAGGSALVLLILAAISALILGMPLSGAGVYIILAILLAPALNTLGVIPIAAHLFLLWFAMTGPITPPSCPTCFVAAAIAGEGAGGISVGWTAMRLAVISYILPFTFIYNPALLLMGGPLQTALAVITALAGVIFLVVGLQGWFFYKMSLLIRAISVGAGIMFIWPGLTTDLIGLAIAVPVVIYQLLQTRRKQPEALGTNVKSGQASP